MAKKTQQPQKRPQDESQTSLADVLSNEMLAKLKDAKKQLTAAEETKQQQEKQRKIQERKEREKNKSFEELLAEYGDEGSKY